MKKSFFPLVVCLIVASPGMGQGDLASQFAGLRAADVRLGTALFRLAKANDELCEKRGPLTGLVLHDLASYDSDVRDAVIRHFDFESPVGVEGVIAGSPAASAGIRADDSVTAIDGEPVPAGATREAALARIDAAGATRPLTLEVRRRGQLRSITLDPIEGCVAHIEVDVSDDLNAATDGDTIQVDSALVNLVAGDDAALASIVAHELSHIVLKHPERLTAAHVDRGLFKGFGRSARLFKQTENEADRLSVVLLVNAGYDPQAAVRYWLTYGPRLNDHGGFGSTHPSWRDRARLIGEEVERVSHETQRPIIPAWIASRDRPLR